MNFLNHRYCAALTLIPGRKMAPQTGTFMASNEALTRFQSASRSRQLHKHILFHECCEKGILFSWSGLWRKRHKFKLTTSVSCEGRKYKRGGFCLADKRQASKSEGKSIFRLQKDFPDSDWIMFGFVSSCEHENIYQLEARLSVPPSTGPLRADPARNLLCGTRHAAGGSAFVQCDYRPS